MIIGKNPILLLLLLGNLFSWSFDFAMAQDQAQTNFSVKDLPNCTKVGRKAPPIWVTVTGFDTDKDRDYKNFQNYTQGVSGLKDRESALKLTDKTVKSLEPMIVPKRSIVRLSPEFQSLVETQGDLEKNALKWVPVKIVSIPPGNSELRKAVSGNTASIAKHKFLDTAKVGTEGHIQIGDLEKIESQKDYVFILKRDSPLYKSLHNPSNPYAPTTEAFSLELHQVNGLYQVNQCCNESGNICRDFAIFKAQGVKDKSGKDVFVHATCENCLLNSLVPMQSDFAKPLQSILSHPSLGLDTASPYSKLMSIGNLNFVDSRGMVQIPVQNIPGDNVGQLGPYGSYRYVPNSKPLAKGNPDIYLRPETACGFIQALKTWNEKYCPNSKPDCRVEFGDASHALEKKFNSHNDHDNGDCIDIRPMGNSANAPSGREFSDKDFNREAFLKLMGVLDQLGPENCFINDSEIRRKFPACKAESGHHNHLHICFPRHKVNSKTGQAGPNLKLQKACQEGVR